MLRIFALVTFAAASLVAAGHETIERSTPVLPFCATPGETSESGLDVLRHVAVATDTGSVNERTRLGVGVLTAQSVQLVTNEALCQTASAKYDEVVGDPPSGRAVYVYTFGSRFIVDYPQFVSHYRRVFAFDSTWQQLPTTIAF